MKRMTSVLIITALVISLAAVMNGCGKDAKPAGPTTEAADESSTGSRLQEDLQNMFGDLSELAEEQESISFTEHTTDEHYQEDYEALTLPPATTAAKPSGNAARTTASAMVPQTTRRETTTQFQFTSPTTAATTAKASGNASTTRSTVESGTVASTTAQETVSDTTVMADRIADSNVVSVGDAAPIPRPNVTYLDKYVLDVLRSGSYTMQMEMKADGRAVPVTYYVNADNTAVKTNMGQSFAEMMELPVSLGKLGDVRFIMKNMSTDPKIYIASSLGYYEFEGDEMESIKETFKEIDLTDQMQFAMVGGDNMEYCGFETHPGYIVEIYKIPETNEMYCFYFDGEGLDKWEVIDMSTNQLVSTTTIKLTSGVSDKNAFKVSGKKLTDEDLSNVIEKMAG